MSVAVILLFVAMVLAPCVVALWGRLRPEPDEELSEPVAVIANRAEEAPVPLPATLPTHPVLDRFRGHARKTTGTPVVEPGVPPPALAPPIAASGPTLEDLLAQAVESARTAKAAAMRADAAASDVAARLAAARVEAATEAANLSRRVADEAADAADAAVGAYEALLARQALDAGREIRLVPDRRAA